MTETKPVHKGRCLCGAVSYEAEGPPVLVAHCYCNNCQRASGSGHATGAIFPVERFRLQGQVAEFRLQSERGTEVTRVFCPTCGSPILGRNSGMAGFVTIALGTLDHSSDFEPQVIIFARNRKPWDNMDESLPAFASQPDWKPTDEL